MQTKKYFAGVMTSLMILTSATAFAESDDRVIVSIDESGDVTVNNPGRIGDVVPNISGSKNSDGEAQVEISTPRTGQAERDNPDSPTVTAKVRVNTPQVSATQRDEIEVVEVDTPDDVVVEVDEDTGNAQSKNTKPKKLKEQKARFIKLAADDNYTYYLDKESVIWKRMPYSASEYMADIWVRMIENDPDTSDLSEEDRTEYLSTDSTLQDEIESAKEKGKALNPVDIEVLRHSQYVLEHYYLRPAKHQIQFLGEHEVVGRPQNTVNERQYAYKNWEELVPGSIESIIYVKTLKIIGTGKASDKGHMGFKDYLEEYLRISIR